MLSTSAGNAHPCGQRHASALVVQVADLDNGPKQKQIDWIEVKDRYEGRARTDGGAGGIGVSLKIIIKYQNRPPATQDKP